MRTRQRIYSCRCTDCDCPGSTTRSQRICDACLGADQDQHPGPPPGDGARLLQVVLVEVAQEAPGAVLVDDDNEYEAAAG